MYIDTRHMTRDQVERVSTDSPYCLRLLTVWFLDQKLVLPAVCAWIKQLLVLVMVK